MTIRVHRIAAAGALAVAAVAAPIAIALTSADTVSTDAGPCLSWIGNKEDGVCAGYSNGFPINVGTPFGIYGPEGWQSGPVVPGTTWNREVG